MVTYFKMTGISTSKKDKFTIDDVRSTLAEKLVKVLKDIQEIKKIEAAGNNTRTK